MQKVEANESKGKGGGNESERKGRRITREKGEGKDARIRQFLFFKFVIAILALKH